jgi:septum formation protein
MPALILASGSPARLRLLRDAGLDPLVVVSGADETNDAGLPTASLVAELARRKATAVAAERPEALVLGCDSMLDLDGEALGKPASAVSPAARAPCTPGTGSSLRASRRAASRRRRSGSARRLTPRSRPMSPPVSRCRSRARSASTAAPRLSWTASTVIMAT